MKKNLINVLGISILLFVFVWQSCKAPTYPKVVYQERQMSRNDLQEYLMLNLTQFSFQLMDKIATGKLSAFTDSSLTQAIPKVELNKKEVKAIRSEHTVNKGYFENLFANDWLYFSKYTIQDPVFYNQTALVDGVAFKVSWGSVDAYIAYKELVKKMPDLVNLLELVFQNNHVNQEDLTDISLILFRNWKMMLWNMADNNRLDIYGDLALKEKVDTAQIGFWRQKLFESEAKVGKQEAFIRIIDKMKVKRGHKTISKTVAITTAYPMEIAGLKVAAFSTHYFKLEDFYKQLGPEQFVIFSGLVDFHKTNLFQTGL